MMYRCSGTITVFMSLISILFLALVCTLAESARVQGCRAQAAAVLDIGMFSVFGEYGKELLEEYDVFALDGAYGTGDFQAERMKLRLQEFMSYNANPEKGLDTQGFQLFPLKLTESRINGYTLLTDEGGGAFYQQVVSARKENLMGTVLRKYTEGYKTTQEQEQAAKQYEVRDKETGNKLMELQEEQKKEELRIQEEERQAEADEMPESAEEVQAPVENPLESIKKMKEMGILGLVMKEPGIISNVEINLDEVPSGRTLEQGDLKVEKKQAGIVADGIFQDYLLDTFPNALTEGKDGMDCQVEYILMGKESDLENMKRVVHRLLLLREGSNFAYALGNGAMRKEALLLATAIVGSVPVPGLVTVTQAALLLAWAYGESILDVRIMLAGGKVPMLKTTDTWKLSLENLGKITEILGQCDNGGGEGLAYQDYLRMLLIVGNKEKYPMRAFDMMEQSFHDREGMELFRADACVVRANVMTGWEVKPLFLKMPSAIMGIQNQGSSYEIQGSFMY